MSSWSAAGSARRGGIAGTASASSRRTGPCGSRAVPMPTTTPTASCLATRSSPTSSDTPRFPGAPVRDGVAVRAIDRGRRVRRPDVGRRHAGHPGRPVHRCVPAPHRPAGADTLPASLLARSISAGYRNQGGCRRAGPGHRQRAVGLSARGRVVRGRPDVVLSCGKAPWVPRRLGGHDVFWWLEASGFLDQPVSTLPSPAARLGANPSRPATAAATT